VPGVTGWLVPPREPAALAIAINEALALGRDERQQLGRRAIAHIATNFTREAMCARTIEVYEELLFSDRREASALALAGALPTA
jgi:glycosyltransferase involved in cell wall biosynthesis